MNKQMKEEATNNNIAKKQTKKSKKLKWEWKAVKCFEREKGQTI